MVVDGTPLLVADRHHLLQVRVEVVYQWTSPNPTSRLSLPKRT